MNKIILGIFLSVLIIFNIQISFGYNVTFEEWGTRLQKTPTVCILEPDYEDDKYLTEVFVKKMTDVSRIAIEEWEVHLKQSERTKEKSMWEINQIIIPLEEQKEFDYQECNVFIHFRDKPELEEDWFKVLGKTSYEEGTTGRSEIIIYYSGIKFCKTEDKKFIYYNPCFSDSPRLMQQLSSTVKHEFGHALGLGHYVSDDIQLNIDWARGVINAPSIMSVFTHQNTDENRITPKDIDKVRTLYGEKGFFYNQTIEKKTFQSFESPLQEFIIPKGGLQIASIEGLIYPERLISGIPVILEIINPDGTVIFIDTEVNPKGVFTMQKVIDSSVANGTYFATANYRGEKSNEITFNIVIGEIPETKSQIPQWIKNSAKWWSEDKIEDRDFMLGIKHLIKNGILNSSSIKYHIVDTKTVENIEIIDSDGDGIQNRFDSCVNEPETFNRILDWDGCPETDGIVMGAVIDTDNDGIPDIKDQCPRQKEEYNKIQDSDGCPETNEKQSSKDSDFDGIEDKTDMCPFQEEVYNGYLDNDGCPDVIIESQNKIGIPEWVKQNAKWWVNGEMTDENFTSVIQYLIKVGTIRI